VVSIAMKDREREREKASERETDRKRARHRVGGEMEEVQATVLKLEMKLDIA
jgi:hypothetical protein